MHSLECDVQAANRAVLMQGMFNDDAFSKIKKGARIINVARGGVIDDHALARALDAGQVAQVQLTLAAHFGILHT